MTTSTVSAPATPETLTMTVRYDSGDRFAIDIRDHEVVVDQPPEMHGDDLGPTPTELFIASLASCVGFYARRYLARHHLDADGLAVEVGYEMASKPARVGKVTLRIVVPAGVPELRRDALLAMASHCTVHNTLTLPPEVHVTLG
jgi:putative redox protein